jgi:predicted DNA-binding WGR domain protein
VNRYELKEGQSSKFWEIALEGDTFVVRFGRIGTKGQEQRKSPDPSCLAASRCTRMASACW